VKCGAAFLPHKAGRPPNCGLASMQWANVPRQLAHLDGTSQPACHTWCVPVGHGLNKQAGIPPPLTAAAAAAWVGPFLSIK
jgi:hypothetical protein